MPITAGILDIIHGVAGITVRYLFPFITGIEAGKIIVSGYLEVLLFVCGLLAISGGVCAFRRKRWPLAFAGAVLSLAPSIPYMSRYLAFYNLRYFFPLPTLLGFTWIPAVVAIILTVLSRKQFKRK